MDLDVASFGEGSGTTTRAVQAKRVRHKWTSAFRVMQSLHRFKHPVLGAKSEKHSDHLIESTPSRGKKRFPKANSIYRGSSTRPLTFLAGNPVGREKKR
uniref:Uncharacterized protein n=1 Tax=Elaeophora elaphi TaxID=1147741 RepID=A0A0R3RQA3_9BILA